MKGEKNEIKWYQSGDSCYEKKDIMKSLKLHYWEAMRDF